MRRTRSHRSFLNQDIDKLAADLESLQSPVKQENSNAATRSIAALSYMFALLAEHGDFDNIRLEHEGAPRMKALSCCQRRTLSQRLLLKWTIFQRFVLSIDQGSQLICVLCPAINTRLRL